MTAVTHDKPKTKKDRIIELYLLGDSPADIAQKVGTSNEYVYKEISRYKRLNPGMISQKQDWNIVVKAERPVTTQNNSGLEVQRNSLAFEHSDYLRNYFDYKPISTDQVKEIYYRFHKNEDAATVIAATGIFPPIVYREYIRYLESKSHNPFELQNEIVSRIRDPPDDIRALVEKTKELILLTNDELFLIMHFRLLTDSDSSLIARISNPQLILPEGLDRIKCNFCERPQPGIIIDKNSEIAKQHKQIFVNYTCEPCLNKAMAVRKGNWDFGIYAEKVAARDGSERVNSDDAAASSVSSEKVNSVDRPVKDHNPSMF
jgi:hypothetical protein